MKGRSGKLSHASSLCCLLTSLSLCAYVSANLEINAFLRKMEREGELFFFSPGEFLQEHPQGAMGALLLQDAGKACWVLDVLDSESAS